MDFNFIWSPLLPGKRITQHQESLYMSKEWLIMRSIELCVITELSFRLI